MKRFALAIIIVFSVAVVASCAPGPNSAQGVSSEAAGFWLGLWHGLISLFTFVVSLFNDKVSMYEVNNTGGWYDFGYLLGVMTFWGGGGGSAARGSR